MGVQFQPSRAWRAGVTAGLAALALLGTGLAGTAQAAYPGPKLTQARRLTLARGLTPDRTG